MINSIKYFEKESIHKFENLEDEFMKEPTRLAEYSKGTDHTSWRNHILQDLVYEQRNKNERVPSGLDSEIDSE